MLRASINPGISITNLLSIIVKTGGSGTAYSASKGILLSDTVVVFEKMEGSLLRLTGMCVCVCAFVYVCVCVLCLFMIYVFREAFAKVSFVADIDLGYL